MAEFKNDEDVFNYVDCYYDQNPDYHLLMNSDDQLQYFIFIVTELMYGTIRQENFRINLTRKQRLAQYINLFNSILKIHQKGFINMNIKPENIMSTDKITTGADDFILKFVDFGSMAIKGEYKRLIGTPGYMFPPLYNKRGFYINEQVDIYSFFASIADIEYGEKYIQVNSECYAKAEQYNILDTCKHDEIVRQVFTGYLKVNYGKEVTINSKKGKKLFDFALNPKNACGSLICLVMKYFRMEKCDNDNECPYDDLTVYNEMKNIYEAMPDELILV